MSEENEAPPLENEATDKQNDSNALESIASQDNKTTEIQNQDESNEATGNQEIENSKIKEQLQDIIKEIDDQDKGEQDKEEQGKTEQSTREQDKEEPVEEGQDKGKQNMGDQDREEQDNGEQDSKDKKEQNCQVNGQQDSQDKGEEKSQDKQEQNSQDKGEQKFQDEQEQDSQDKGEQSKDEQKQDSQVTGDQNSQDRSEQNSQDQDSKSQNGMTTDQEQVYHTWQPKGKYDVAKTEVTYEDVVPITVEDVKDPPPVEANTAANEGADQDQTGDARTNASQGLERIGPITVPQLLPNGELGSPIEIPEGIPLLARILPKEEDSNREKIPLERLFTPATDSGEITPRKKKAFASSDFYAADHPTIDDQLELAQRISGSLLDQCNKTSRGQAMYERRKEKSAKWIHQEGLKVAQSEQVKFQAQQTSSDGIETSSSSCSSQSKSKSALKLVMNPRGVQDHTTVEHHYQQLMQDSAHTMTSSQLAAGGGPASAPHLLPQMPPSPEIAKDIITDMQSPTGKGAALFAKRKKRMDKFIVDETNVQKTSAYQQEQQSIVSSNVSTEKLSTCTSSSFTQFNSSSSTSSIASSSSTVQQSNKKKSVQERDKEQKEIMQEFLKNRESQFKLVKSPWDSVLETGNTSAAFKLNQQQQAANFQQSSVPSWLEMPKPVPVNASALPTAVVAQAPPTVFSSPAPLAPGATLPAAPAPFSAPTAPAVVAPKVVAAPSSAPSFVPRKAVVVPSDDRRMSGVNFNVAASGWGTYNDYYRPTTLA